MSKISNVLFKNNLFIILNLGQDNFPGEFNLR